MESNPFAVLGASLRDDRRRLLELADQAALTEDEAMCASARATLSNPRTRLAAEIAWLPGVAPSKVPQLLEGARRKPESIRSMVGLPSLAWSNLMAACLESLDRGISAAEWAEWIVRLAGASQAIETDLVLRDINEERSLAGFPSASYAFVEDAIKEHLRGYGKIVLKALGGAPSGVLVEAMTKAVDETTEGGQTPASFLIEEIASAYDLQITPALEKGADGLQTVLDAARSAGAGGVPAVGPYIDQIEILTRQWDALAQPVQLLQRTRGLDHAPSTRLAKEVRSLAVDLVNEHRLIDEGARLTELVGDAFAELPEVVERVDADLDALGKLSRQREESIREQADWERQIAYSAEVGKIFKKTLSISTDGVSWKQRMYPLDSISRVRWGATRHSINGVPTGTTYTVAFGDPHDESIVELSDEHVFGNFVDRLSRAVALPISLRLLERLDGGAKVRFGEAIVDDSGVTMPRHAIFSSSTPVYGRWDEIRVWVADGSFLIGLASDKKVFAQMPYLTTDNVHLLERLIRKFFESPKARLSQLFQTD
jgi:hypothetical protein